MKVRYTLTALAEIDEILAYIRDRNPAAAAAIGQQIERVISWLIDSPRMGYRIDETGLRMLPVGRYPYLIFYSVDDNEVVIRNVRHAARRRPWQG